MCVKIKGSLAIVVVAYNRPKSISRLLDSLSNAEYETKEVIDLVVSIDKGSRQDEIVATANGFNWTHGKKIIRTFTNRQGLKQHILQCGDLTAQYDAVIILEDDITVSRGFIQYVMEAINYYADEDLIAGISLYSYSLMPYVSRPFIPANNGFDAFLIQVAMSWGQCWTKTMWRSFRDWLKKNDSELSDDGELPKAVLQWDDRSWLKYYDRYLVESNKYFLMPYISLSTNYGGRGEHTNTSSSAFQVPMLEQSKTYIFPPVEMAIKYDAFFERIGFDSLIFGELHGKKILDLYGCKTRFSEGDYLISIQYLPYYIVYKLSFSRRPVEINCLYPESGNGIFVYDLSRPAKVRKKKNTFEMVEYDIYDINWRRTLIYTVSSFIIAIRNKLKKN